VCGAQHTSALQEEGYNVADYENLCEPALAYQRVGLAVCDEDDTPEQHLYTRGVEGRCDEQEDGREGVVGDSPVWAFVCGYGSLFQVSVRVLP